MENKELSRDTIYNNFTSEYGTDVLIILEKADIEEDKERKFTVISNGRLTAAGTDHLVDDFYIMHDFEKPSILRYNECGEIWSREYWLINEYITNSEEEFNKMKQKVKDLSISRVINRIKDLKLLEKYRLIAQEYWLIEEWDEHEENVYSKLMDKIKQRQVVLKLENN